MKVFEFCLYLIIFVVIWFFVHRWLSKFKFPKCGAIAVFTGGVKVGKSAVSLAFALANYKRVHRSWLVKCFFIRLINHFRKNKLLLPEEPYFYSTIPLRGVKYCPLTRQHLLRRKRLHYGSICFIDEASLVADSMLYKDKEVNDNLLLFCKLYGHATHGGKLIFNSHCIGDLHYALRRCTSEYFYIHNTTRYIPFLCVVTMREERFSEDGSTINSYNEDIEDSLKRVLMLKSTFKKYDSFCFSSFTDNLPTDDNKNLVLLGKNDSLKSDKVVSFNPLFMNLEV